MAKKVNQAPGKFTLDVVNENGREVKGGSQGVEFTDELFDKMSFSNQLLVALHEKFVGEIEQVGVFDGRPYILRENLEAIADTFAV